MQVSTAEFKKGLKIQFDGQPYTIVDFQHVKPGKGGAFVRTKLKHMRQGRVIDNTFRAGEKVELVDFEDKHMQYLYKDDRYHFMDTETYDQISLSAEEVGDARDFLKENTDVDILFIDGSPVTVELPNFMELAITKTDPGIRGDTASGGSKPATLESGAVVQVPLFVEPGETVKVEQLPGKVGGKVTFDDVLIVSTEDKKMLTGKDAAAAKVSGKIVAQDRHKKVIVLKFKTGGQYKIRRGHRQDYTSVQVSDIAL